MEKNGLAGSVSLLVLSLLRDGDKYGTLYPVLHQLEREGCLESYSAQAPSGRARKYYRLTSRGRKALADQEVAFRRVAGAVEQVLRRSCPEA